jgi:hypothetical protein
MMHQFIADDKTTLFVTLLFFLAVDVAGHDMRTCLDEAVVGLYNRDHCEGDHAEYPLGQLEIYSQ